MNILEKYFNKIKDKDRRRFLKRSNNVDNEQIEQKAYLLWEKAGKPHGKDLEFWLLAEKLLK